jgi:hypothetical protein
VWLPEETTLSVDVGHDGVSSKSCRLTMKVRTLAAVMKLTVSTIVSTGEPLYRGLQGAAVD